MTSNSKKRRIRKAKVCSRCGHRNHWNVSSCKECGKKRFEPDWVLAKKPIHRQLSVQITRSHPEFGEKDRITLSKWWPGGSATFHIPKPSQWVEIQRLINDELAPMLGWESPSEIMRAIREQENGKKGEEIAKLVDQHPNVLFELVSAIDFEQLGSKEFSHVVEVLGQISDVMTNANAGFREAYLSIIKKLPTQKQRALEDLELLLQGWSLHVVTNVAQQVKARLEVIELFEQQIQDDRTLEIDLPPIVVPVVMLHQQAEVGKCVG